MHHGIFRERTMDVTRDSHPGNVFLRDVHHYSLPHAQDHHRTVQGPVPYQHRVRDTALRVGQSTHEGMQYPVARERCRFRGLGNIHVDVTQRGNMKSLGQASVELNQKLRPGKARVFQ